MPSIVGARTTDPRKPPVPKGIAALDALADVAAAAATEHQRVQIQSSSSETTTGAAKSDDETTLEGAEEASLNDEQKLESPAPAAREISLGSKSAATNATFSQPQHPYHLHLQPRF